MGRPIREMKRCLSSSTIDTNATGASKAKAASAVMRSKEGPVSESNTCIAPNTAIRSSASVIEAVIASALRKWWGVV